VSRAWKSGSLRWISTQFFWLYLDSGKLEIEHMGFCGGGVDFLFMGLFLKNLKLCFSNRLGNQSKILGVEDLSVFFWHFWNSFRLRINKVCCLDLEDLRLFFLWQFWNWDLESLTMLGVQDLSWFFFDHVKFRETGKKESNILWWCGRY
jgi:hypothetical protein